MFTLLLKTIYPLIDKLINNRLSSSFIYKLTRSSFSKKLIPYFIKKYDINTDEAEKSVAEYSTLEEFFTRKIKLFSRDIKLEANSILSPVDGYLSLLTDISFDNTFNVKGKNYSLVDLLGSHEAAEPYIHGTVMVIYLSPQNYHRIHIPIKSYETNFYYLGKYSYPVNDFGLKYGKNTLTKNYRLISHLKATDFTYCLIPVGAMNVNSIHRTHNDLSSYDQLDEFGWFSFGSTVIMLFPPDSITLSLAQKNTRVVKCGDVLATSSSR